MERLEDFTKDLPVGNAARLVGVLFDEGDNLRFESRGFLDVTADMQVARVIYQCLSRLTSEQERHELLLEQIAKGAGLYTLVQEVALCEPTEKETERRLISDHALWEQLRDAAVARTRGAHAAGDLWQVRHLPYVLFRWMQWTNEAEVQAAVTQHVADNANFLTFLGGFVAQSQSHTMGDKIGRKHTQIGKKSIAAFLKLEDVAARLQAIAAQGGQGADVARGLLDLLEKKSEGPWDD